MNEAQVTRAWARARRLYKAQRFQKAYVAGASAAYAGRPADSCPYRSREGWSAWRTAWLRGHRSIAT